MPRTVHVPPQGHPAAATWTLARVVLDQSRLLDGDGNDPASVLQLPYIVVGKDFHVAAPRGLPRGQPLDGGLSLTRSASLRVRV